MRYSLIYYAPYYKAYFIMQNVLESLLYIFHITLHQVTCGHMNTYQ